MAAVAFVLPYPIVALPTNVGAPGAKLYFYSPNMTTIVPVYSTSALTTQLSNPVVADGAGRVPTIWLNGASTYKLVIKSKSGTVLYTQDPYTPGTLTGVVTASGASTVVSVASFGAVGDGVTDDSAAFLSAIAYLQGLRYSGTEYGYSRGSAKLFIPASLHEYYLGTTTLDIYHSLIIEGEGGSGPSGDTTVLRWAAGTTGIRVHSNISSGASSFVADRGYSGTGTIIRDLMLIGGFVATESESHGVHIRAHATLENLFIHNFAGDGIFADTTSFDSVHNDNVNGANFVRPFVRSCRNGIYINYNDANAIHITNPQCFSNRRYGIWKKDGLGCHITGGDMTSNGQVSGWPTVVSSGGHYYFCLPNQEVGASTNAPSGATTTNTWWGYDSTALGDGAATATRPAWVSGTTYRSGGCARIEGGSEYSTVVGLYREIDQAPLQCSGKTVVIGGIMSAVDFLGAPYGGHITGDAAGIYVNQNIAPLTPNNGAVGIPTAPFASANIGAVNATVSVTMGGGTALTKAVVYTPTITPASVAAATVAEQTFTVTGLTTADKVIVNPPAIANATGIVGARVSATNTLAIRFANPTAGALTPTSGVYPILAFRS